MRGKLVAGNWKLHKSIPEALAFVSELKAGIGKDEEVEVVVAPVFTALAAVGQALKGSPIRLAAQNCYPEEKGAFTGEVSPPLLKDAGCHYVIIGHSERRQIFNESDSFINRKVKAATAEGLYAILCVGETLEERDGDKTFETLENQIKNALRDIPTETMGRVVIAYEPVWAIGTGKNASAAQAQEAHHFLRRLLGQIYDVETSDKIRILYGGSVKAENAGDLLFQPDIDGALVGGASLKATDFLPIIKQAKK